ncbi:LysR family transcriptional regulator [Yinghuangia seranimata]|uniref:LysR family transcriptional regulator n=1 Tax=Yinghuangia seranimata TaxID=408067 RepID=UPI00248CA5DC|nr:LysR family transcriptional regulator [Yinghuangia seranimata]MDI2130732.1 LysR family transcriptional regulator [Yinghuangia seranimata]
MTIDDLRTFLAACRHGNLSAVARELGVTQSAVSQHIKRLEREVGLDLLERRPRGVAPTDAGRILYAAARDSLAGLDLALRQLRDLRDGHGGTVRIATGATTVRHFMTDAIVAFRRADPTASLEFQTESSSRTCLAAVAAGTADLAWVTIGDPVRGVEQRPVAALPWMLAVRRDDPLAEKASLCLDDLAGIHHIRLPETSTSRLRLDGHLAAHAIRPPANTGVADWDTAMLLAELGLGHAVVPDLPNLQRTPDGPLRLVPIPDLPPLTVGWAARQWAALAPAARAFADAVEQASARGGPAEHRPG